MFPIRLLTVGSENRLGCGRKDHILYQFSPSDILASSRSGDPYSACAPPRNTGMRSARTGRCDRDCDQDTSERADHGETGRDCMASSAEASMGVRATGRDECDSARPAHNPEVGGSNPPGSSWSGTSCCALLHYVIIRSSRGNPAQQPYLG
jgi:hypothetical protein